jgi:hypothetical protein
MFETKKGIGLHKPWHGAPVRCTRMPFSSFFNGTKSGSEVGQRFICHRLKIVSNRKAADK